MRGYPLQEGDLHATKVGVATFSYQVSPSPEVPIDEDATYFAAEPRGLQVLRVPEATIQLAAGGLGEWLDRAALAEYRGEPIQVLLEIGSEGDSFRLDPVFFASQTAPRHVPSPLPSRSCCYPKDYG